MSTMKKIPCEKTIDSTLCLLLEGYPFMNLTSLKQDYSERKPYVLLVKMPLKFFIIIAISKEKEPHQKEYKKHY